MNDFISIVIPTYNSGETIRDVIESCLEQDYNKENFQIIVVDDGSTDNTGEIVKKYPVDYLSQSNKGPASARNLGWKKAKGEIICFIDSDCVPFKDWLKNLVNGFKNKDIGAVAGSYDIINKDSLLAKCIHEEIKQRHFNMKKYIKVFGGYNVAIRKKVLKECGGFDESYLSASGEDNDLSYKILKKNYKIYFSDEALVKHYYPRKLSVYLKKQFRHGFWRVKLYKNHMDMVKGDDYSNGIDYVQPILSLIVLFLVPLGFLPLIRNILLIILFLNIILHLPLVFKIVRETKKIKYFIFLPISFLRSFVRGVGMFFGILSFFVVSK